MTIRAGYLLRELGRWRGGPGPLSRILLILGEFGPGDALRIRDCLRAVRESHPTADIVLVGAEQAVPALEHARLADRIVVTRVHVQRGASMLQTRLKKARELARLALEVGAGYDIAVIFSWGWETTAMNLLARLVARRQIGYASRFPGLLSSNLGGWSFDKDPYEQNLALLAAAGVRPSAPGPMAMHAAEDEAVVGRLLDEQGLGDSTRLVVLHPGSDWACQQWRPDRWAMLADRLVADYAADVVFTGVAGERAHIDAIRARMQAPSASLAGETTLPQLCALLSRVRLCICVDSVIYELTQATGLPAVVLAGPSSPESSPAGAHPPMVVNRATPDLKEAINACRVPKYSAGGCLDASCPMAGLREIGVLNVLKAVERQAALERVRLPLVSSTRG